MEKNEKPIRAAKEADKSLEFPHFAYAGIKQKCRCLRNTLIVEMVDAHEELGFKRHEKPTPEIFGKMLEREERALELVCGLKNHDESKVNKWPLSERKCGVFEIRWFSRIIKGVIEAGKTGRLPIIYINPALTNSLAALQRDIAYTALLRYFILLSETFPDTQKHKFEAWLNELEERETGKNPNPKLTQEKPQVEVKAEEKSEPESENLEPEQAKEEEKAEDKAEVKKKGGRTPESLFKDAEETEKMKKIFLEYIQSELEITLEDLRKMEFDSKRNNKLNIAIVKWLKKMQTENIFDIYRGIPKRAAYRFLLECLKPYGLTINADEKIYGNKLSEWLK